MKYICSRCGESFAVRPLQGTCRICDATLIPESEVTEPEHRGETEGLPSARRRL